MDPQNDERAQEPGDSVQDRAVAALREVYDPEIPVNIYDLGLIYDLQIDEQGQAKVVMTLTTPACPEAEMMPGRVRAQVGSVEGIEDCEVELVWDPPWNKDMISEEAKMLLGLE